MENNHIDINNVNNFGEKMDDITKKNLIRDNVFHIVKKILLKKQNYI